MLLTNKNAVIYGASPSLGGAVAEALAAAGAKVFVTARRIERAEDVAARIEATGAAAEAAVVDALDPRAIEEHLAYVVRTARSLDVSFNLINIEETQNIALVDMSAADFVRPLPSIAFATRK